MKIYEVRNKVFSELFADKESAEEFIKICGNSSSNGLEIIERYVISTKEVIK